MSFYQEELAVLKRQHVTRSLSFSADVCEGDIDDGNENMSVDDKNDNDAHNGHFLKDMQFSNKQVTCVHFIFVHWIS